jgi:predicted phosphodiesterase
MPKGYNLSDQDREMMKAALKATGCHVLAARTLLGNQGHHYSQGTISNLLTRIPRKDKIEWREAYDELKEVALTPAKHILKVDDLLVRSALIKKLRRGKATPADLATQFECEVDLIHSMVGTLREAGYNVEFKGGAYSIGNKPGPKEGEDILVDNSPLTKMVQTYGVISDTHLCSRYQRLDVLEAAYNEYQRLGIKRVFHCGNMVDGHCHFNRFDLLVTGLTDQAHYVLDHYPQRAGMTTYFITADDHEGWWQQREGIDFGKYLVYEATNVGRKDLVWLGYEEADVEFRTPGGGNTVRLMHPGGGSAYALSYAPQKIVESFQGGEKPGVLLIGHYHKAMYAYVRNVHTLQCGTCEDQTLFMRKQKLEAHVGFWTVSMRQDINGAIREFSPTFTAFYDRGYHQNLVVKGK